MKIDRLVSIIMILMDKKRMGARELAEMFEVSLRTIYRDIDSINMAGIPVRSTPGVGGGFEIMEKYRIDNKVFSEADLSTILMGLSGLSDMMRGDELVNALAKVKSFIPADKSKEIELRANQFLIDLSPWMGNRSIQTHLDTIKKAMEENRLITFAYAGLTGDRTARTVEPYQLVLKSSHWYCHAYCRTREDFRLFKLNRMSDLKLGEERFPHREHPKPQLDFIDMLERRQTKIRIRIHRSLMERVLDFCPLQNFSPDDGDYWLVDFPFIENDYYYGVLLSFGNRCECLGPAPVRGEMKRRIKEMAAMYRG